jgi:hypothetical protein
LARSMDHGALAGASGAGLAGTGAGSGREVEVIEEKNTDSEAARVLPGPPRDGDLTCDTFRLGAP